MRNTIITSSSTGKTATLGSLAALVAAIGYALGAITLRMLTRTDTTASVVIWTISTMTVLAGLIALRKRQNA